MEEEKPKNNQFAYEKTMKLIEMLKVIDENEEKIIGNLREIVKNYPIEKIKDITNPETRELIIRAYAEIAAYDVKKNRI